MHWYHVLSILMQTTGFLCVWRICAATCSRWKPVHDYAILKKIRAYIWKASDSCWCYGDNVVSLFYSTSLKCKQKQYKDVYFSNWVMSQNDPNDERNNLLLQTDSNLRGSLHNMVSSSFSEPLNGSFFFLCYNILKPSLIYPDYRDYF